MKISVVIPSYQPQKWIWECLDSIVMQDFPKYDFETIIILNGCNEPYFSQIEEYISRKMAGMNVHITQTDTPGVSNARNIGIDLAKGEYIAFIDDDDYISPSYLKELYDIAIKGYVPISYLVNVDDNTKQLSPSFYTAGYDKVKDFDEFSLLQAKPFLWIIYSKLLQKNNHIRKARFDTGFKIGEDSLFMFVISPYLDKFRTTSKNAVYYRRIRANSAMTSKRSNFSKLKNNFRMEWAYTKIYFKNLGKYSFKLYRSRMIGELMAWTTWF